MRNFGIIFLLTIAVTPLLYAQDNGNKLTIPSSPAFSILDFEPTAVMKPTDNKDLATDILNSFDPNGKLIMNLGLEVTPYWLQSRPTLTREKYLNPNPGQAFLQSFSLSAATVRDSASGDNKLGGGFRFKLFNGKPVSDLKESQDKLTLKNTIQSDIAAARAMVTTEGITTIQEAMDYITSTMKKQNFSESTIEEIQSLAGQFENTYPINPTNSDIRDFLGKLNDAVDSTKQEILEQVATLTKQRTGFVLEFAGATGYNLSNTKDLEKAGFWVNASNYVSASDLFTFTARYMFRNDDTSLYNFDAGLSYMKKAENYNVSIEYMLRWYGAETPDINLRGEQITVLRKGFSYRLAAQGSYLINSNISVNMSFGKDFSDPFIRSSGFFSIFGINYSIFNNEKIRY